MLLIRWRRRGVPDAMVLGRYFVGAGMIRFAIEFVRDDPRGDVFGLTSLTGLSTSQLISLVIGITSLILLILRWRRTNSVNLENPVVLSKTAV